MGRVFACSIALNVFFPFLSFELEKLAGQKFFPSSWVQYKTGVTKSDFSHLSEGHYSRRVCLNSTDLFLTLR